MKRGDVVVAALSRDYGKPRPAIVIQTDMTTAMHPGVTLCPLTSRLNEFPQFRLRIEPQVRNGLRAPSDAMVDKVQTLPRERIRGHIGTLDGDTTRALDSALRVWLGLA